MKTFNRITLLGRVGKPPEVRQTAGGLTLARFSIATDRAVRDGDQWSQVADWHNVVCFDRLARLAAERLTAGEAVLIDGELHYDRWEDESGRPRRTPRVLARNLSLLGGPGARPALAELAAPEGATDRPGEPFPDEAVVPF